MPRCWKRCSAGGTAVGSVHRPLARRADRLRRHGVPPRGAVRHACPPGAVRRAPRRAPSRQPAHAAGPRAAHARRGGGGRRAGLCGRDRAAAAARGGAPRPTARAAPPPPHRRARPADRVHRRVDRPRLRGHDRRPRRGPAPLRPVLAVGPGRRGGRGTLGMAAEAGAPAPAPLRRAARRERPSRVRDPGAQAQSEGERRARSGHDARVLSGGELRGRPRPDRALRGPARRAEEPLALAARGSPHRRRGARRRVPVGGRRPAARRAARRVGRRSGSGRGCDGSAPCPTATCPPCTPAPACSC